MTHPPRPETWDRLKHTAARRWPRLTTAELESCLANDGELVRLIQDRYGLNRRDAVAEMVAVRAAASGDVRWRAPALAP